MTVPEFRSMAQNAWGNLNMSPKGPHMAAKVYTVKCIYVEEQVMAKTMKTDWMGRFCQRGRRKGWLSATVCILVFTVAIKRKEKNHNVVVVGLYIAVTLTSLWFKILKVFHVNALYLCHCLSVQCVLKNNIFSYFFFSFLHVFVAVPDCLVVCSFNSPYMMNDKATCCDLFQFSALKLDLHGICGSPAINFDLPYLKAICSIKRLLFM